MAAKILLTGSEGYIGSWVQSLLGSKYEVLCVDQMGSPDIKKSIEDLSFDDFDPSTIEYIIHLAARRLNQFTEQNLAAENSLQLNFLHSLKNYKNLKHVIFSSSCSVYGESSLVMTEESAVTPSSYYAESKLFVEQWLQKSDLPFTIFRFGTAYGSSTNLRIDLLINEMAANIKLGKITELFGVNAYRPYILAKDMAKTLVQALELGPNGVINRAESNWTKQELVELMIQLGAPKHCFHLRYDRPDIRDYRVVCAKAQSLGFEPLTSLPVGLSQWMNLRPLKETSYAPAP